MKEEGEEEEEEEEEEEGAQFTVDIVPECYSGSSLNLVTHGNQTHIAHIWEHCGKEQAHAMSLMCPLHETHPPWDGSLSHLSLANITVSSIDSKRRK